MLAAAPGRIRRLLADKGYDADWLRANLRASGTVPVIPGIRSQAHEGWRPLRDRYDDGGFSGGSLERPALQRLLDAIRARRIDIVVVYKVDRLTRSLSDFAKLVELFDQQGVSFVSVTQSFNTTSSMGRLTLNVLLSFAQFEREVTGERIRDKIAASKRKGIWVGGIVPFGYAVRDRKLVVEEAEAATVRLAFGRYLALGSLPALQRWMREQGIVTQPRSMRTGGSRGGVAFTNGPLQHLLRNRVYLGELNHRGQSFPAEHPPIVDAALFAAVQARLDANRVSHETRRQGGEALLTGLIFDDRGNRMSPTHATRRGLRYRYYVSTALVQGRRADAGTVARVPAEAIETAVCDALAVAAPRDPRPASRAELAALVERITIGAGTVTIVRAASDGSDAPPAPITVAWAPPPQRPRREIIAMADAASTTRPIRSEARSRLLSAIAKARAWLDELTAGTIADTAALAMRETISERTARQMLSLAFLAPDIVEAAASGMLPRGFGVSRLTDLTIGWDEQRRTLGIAG